MQQPIYSIKNLILSKGKDRILNINKFDLHRGAMYLFNGHVGSGKSSLMNVFSKNQTISNGMLLYEGNDLNLISQSEYQNDITYLKEKNDKPWFGNTSSNYLKKIIKKGNPKNADSSYNKICNSMKIPSSILSKNVSDLTDGEFRWLLLSGAIAVDNKVLFIDYIDKYLDYNKRMILNRVLKRKTSYDGVTVIGTTYNPEAFKMSASVHIKIDKGRITQVRSASNKSK